MVCDLCQRKMEIGRDNKVRCLMTCCIGCVKWVVIHAVIRGLLAWKHRLKNGDEILGQQDVIDRHSIKEKRGDLVDGKASNTAAYRRHEERQFEMIDSKRNKLVDIGLNGLYPTLHCGDSIALSLQADSLSPDGAEALMSNASCSASVKTS